MEEKGESHASDRCCPRELYITLGLQVEGCKSDNVWKKKDENSKEKLPPESLGKHCLSSLSESVMVL